MGITSVFASSSVNLVPTKIKHNRKNVNRARLDFIKINTENQRAKLATIDSIKIKLDSQIAQTTAIKDRTLTKPKQTVACVNVDLTRTKITNQTTAKYALVESLHLPLTPRIASTVKRGNLTEIKVL